MFKKMTILIATGSLALFSMASIAGAAKETTTTPADSQAAVSQRDQDRTMSQDRVQKRNGTGDQEQSRERAGTGTMRQDRVRNRDRIDQGAGMQNRGGMGQGSGNGSR